MDRATWTSSACTCLMTPNRAFEAHLRHPGQKEPSCPPRLLCAPKDGEGGVLAGPNHRSRWPCERDDATPPTCDASVIDRPGQRQDSGVPHQPHRPGGAHHLRPVQEPLAGRAVLQVDQTAPEDQAFLRHFRRMPSSRNSGWPSRSTCWSRRFASNSESRPPSTRYSRSCRSCRLQVPLYEVLTKSESRSADRPLPDQLPLFAP